MKLTIEISDTQLDAFKLLGLTTSKELTEVVDTATATTLRSRISAKVESAEADAATAYDHFANRGVKLPISREEWISNSRDEFETAFVALGGKRRAKKGEEVVSE